MRTKLEARAGAVPSMYPVIFPELRIVSGSGSLPVRNLCNIGTFHDNVIAER